MLWARIRAEWPKRAHLACANHADANGIRADLIRAGHIDAARTIVLTRVRDSRAADNARLGAAALRSSRNVIFAETVRQALSWARSVTPPDGLVCVAGSLHLVGEVKRLMEEADSQTAVM